MALNFPRVSHFRTLGQSPKGDEPRLRQLAVLLECGQRGVLPIRGSGTADEGNVRADLVPPPGQDSHLRS